MTETLIPNKQKFEILTDTGWQSFDGIVNKGIKHTITITLENTKVTLTPDHNIFLDSLKKIPATELKIGDKVCTFTGPQEVISIKENCLEQVYDLVNVKSNKRFYANDVLCSNCEFIVADETLIAPAVLIELEGIEPFSRMGQVRWYKKPEKGNIYCIALDPSLGTGSDPAAIEIFEANTTTQIGEWKHNRTNIPSQIKLLAQINKYILDFTSEPNNIYYSIENNSIGEAALLSLVEYGEGNIPGIFLSERGKKRKGFNTTHRVKLSACAKLKTLVENKKMKITSKSLVSELKTFVAAEGSYKAKVGETDDLVMASLLVVRMLQELSDYHVSLETQMRDHEEFIQPLPFFAILS